MTREKGSRKDVEMDESPKGRKRHRASTPEYKADVVAMCLKGRRSVRALALDLGLSQRTVHRWVMQAETEAGHARA
jgi:transposase